MGNNRANTKERREMTTKHTEIIEKYTTWGSVRGCCGHMHKTADAAERCIAKDDRGCKMQGGYSDRVVHVVSHRDQVSNYDVTVGPGIPTD